jgi:poly(A) polymerase
LRAFRFQSQIGFRIENATYKAIKRNAFRIMYISEERIQQEMNKLLLGESVVKALADMMDATVLNFFIPELYPLKNLHQESNHHHKDVWMHTLKVVENTPKEEILRWAALLHDIAKPYVKVEDKNGIHFHRHEELGSKMAYSILSRLKFPKSWREDISFLIARHMRANLYTKEWTDSAVRRFIRETGSRLEKVLTLSRCDITSYRKEKVREKLKLLY